MDIESAIQKRNETQEQIKKINQSLLHAELNNRTEQKFLLLAEYIFCLQELKRLPCDELDLLAKAKTAGDTNEVNRLEVLIRSDLY